MIKKGMIVGFIMLMMTVASYAAPDRTGKVDAGITVLGALSTDNDINSTAYVGGNIAYGINEWFAIGFESGWQKHGSNDVTDGTTTIFGPDFTAVPLFGDLILRVPIENQPVTPYGVAGLGTVLWDVNSASFNSAGVGGTVTTKVSSSFAAKVGGGFDWFINKNWIVNFEGAYVFDRPDVTASANASGVSASAISSVKLDYWTVGGGVKYLFD